MKLKIILFAIVAVIFCIPEKTFPSSSASVKCNSYRMDLSGQSMNHGVLYKEHLVLEKVVKSGNAQGKWKMVVFNQDIIYPQSIKFSLNQVDHHDLGHGFWMKNRSIVSGNTVKTILVDSNLVFDVKGNKIGSAKTGIWGGTIKGKTATFKFHQESPYEPTLKGIVALKGEKLKLTITEPSQDKKYVFSKDSPGKLTIIAKAKVSPSKYSNDIVWTVPRIPGSVLKVEPENEKGPMITCTYTNLPAKNKHFGIKKIRARIQADDCKAKVSQTVKIFFPLLATNNPDGNVPNWFYYWKQTSARIGPAKYKGSSGMCGSQINRSEGTLGYYRYKHLENVYYICDLSRLGENFDFKMVKWTASNISEVPVTGIDTFAAASYHENGHYSHFKQWWFAHKANQPFSPAEDMNKNSIKDSVETPIDKDQDLIPDSLEPGFNLDPTKKYTYGGAQDDDEEVLTWKDESKWQVGSANKEDWAKPGKQWPAQ